MIGDTWALVEVAFVPNAKEFGFRLTFKEGSIAKFTDEDSALAAMHYDVPAYPNTATFLFRVSAGEGVRLVRLAGSAPINAWLDLAIARSELTPVQMAVAGRVFGSPVTAGEVS